MDDRIVVTGAATEELEPYRASWGVVVSQTDPDPRVAFEACGQQARRLLAALQEVAGDESMIATSVIRLAPRWDARHEHEIDFEAISEVTATIAVARAGAVAKAAVDAGATQLQGPTFIADDVQHAHETCLSEAVATAERKARRIAEAAGGGLGRVRSVQETFQDRGTYGRRSGARMESHQPAIEPTKLTVFASVLASFEFIR